MHWIDQRREHEIWSMETDFEMMKAASQGHGGTHKQASNRDWLRDTQLTSAKRLSKHDVNEYECKGLQCRPLGREIRMPMPNAS